MNRDARPVQTAVNACLEFLKQKTNGEETMPFEHLG